jgi:Translationally controlled tumour protein
MIIFKDLITDDEVISDSYNVKEIDGVVYEADCKRITLGVDNINIGANASAEEQEEGVEDQAKTVIDVVHSFRLNETHFEDKKQYMLHLKCLFPRAGHKVAANRMYSVYEECQGKAGSEGCK